jgi:2-hydroxy-6-oxonona-2,4-dienedioate hydrolase
MMAIGLLCRPMLQYPINVGGVTTRVLEDGERGGRAVVCLHGAGSRADRFRPLLERLAKANFNAFALDFPGHGWAQPPIEMKYSSPLLAEFALGVADALGLTSFALIGTSLGGHVAAHMCIRQPQRVDAVVLVGATGIVHYERDPQKTSSKITGTDEAGTRAKLEFLVYDDSLVTDGWVREESRINSAPGRPEAMSALFGYLAEGLPGDVCGQPFAETNKPTAIFWGKHDRWVPLDVGYKIAQLLPSAPFYVLERTGHAPYFERPAAFARRVSAFLNDPASCGPGLHRV